MSRISRAKVELLLRMARDAARGVSFLERMEELTKTLSAAVPTTSATAFVIDPAGGDPPPHHVMFRNRDARDLVAYATHYRRIDPMAGGLEAATGAVVKLSDFVRDRRFGADEFTSEFLPRIRVRRVMAFSERAPDGRVFAYAIHRERGRKDFRESERAMLELVAPDLARAAFGALLGEKLAALEAAPADGVLVVDARGEVLHGSPGPLARLRDAKVVDLMVADVRRMAETGVARLQRALPDLRIRIDQAGPDRFVVALETPAGVAALAREVGLTKRESEVATLAIRGLGNGEIARALRIAEATVATHLARIYMKTGVSGRTELAARALKNGG